MINDVFFHREWISMRFILLLFIFLICAITSLHADESESSAFKIELVERDGNNFQVACFFNNAIVTTYFNRVTYSSDFNFVEPCKQVFNYLNQNKLFETPRSYATLYKNGYISYMFTYDLGYSIKDHTLCVWLKYTPADASFEASYQLERIKSDSYWD